ncbi:KxYKxGKxW signal peptide domain-containing protein [Lacticaseibacillus nasuensis]|nr:KxYKxGKxW signal peptide domain-containing protein [Lacticaseibacillus nasuensis]
MEKSIKTHYKMYKAGRRWLFAAITVASIGIGISAGHTVSVAAAETPSTQETTATSPAAQTPTAETSSAESATAAGSDNAQSTTPATTQPDATTSTAAQSAPATHATNAQPVAAPIAPEPAPAPTATVTGEADVTASLGGSDHQATTHYTDNQDNSDDVLNATNYTTDSTHLTTTLTVSNPTSNNLHVHPVLLLPNFAKPNSDWVVDASKVTEATFTSAFPNTIKLTYSMHGFNGEYLSYANLMAQHPTFTWDQLQAVMVDGTLAPGTSYTLTLPMKWLGSTPEDYLNPSSYSGAVEVMNFNSGNYTVYTDMHATSNLAAPVTFAPTTDYATIKQPNGSYQVAPAALQKLAPQFALSDIQISTDGVTWSPTQTAANTPLLSTGAWRISTEAIYQAYKDLGYTVSAPEYTYNYSDVSLVNPAGDGTGSALNDNPGAGESGLPAITYLYYEIVPVLAAHNSTVTVDKTDTYRPEDNFEGRTTVLAGDPGDTSYTITDPTGVLTKQSDGTYTYNHDGHFTVTYTAPLASGPVTKTITVTVHAKPTYGTAQSTRTINFVNADGTQAPQPVVQTVNYKTVTNSLTGETVYTPQGAYAEYVPSQTGYSADVASIAQLAPAPSATEPQNSTVTVTYTPQLTFGTATSTRTIKLVSVDGSFKPQTIVQTINYKTVTNAVTGQTTYTAQDFYPAYATAKAGYTADVASIDSVVPEPTTTKPADTTMTVTYTPQLTYGTATTTRTIAFTDAAGKSLRQPVIQTITYKTVTNAVTGETIYTPQGAYQAYVAPSIAGYKSTAAQVAQQAVGASTTLPDDSLVTVTYTKLAVLPNTQGEGETTKPHSSGNTETSQTAATAQPGAGLASSNVAETSTTPATPAAATAAHRLPTTGDTTGTTLAMLGATLIAGFGLAGLRKREH